MVSCVEITASVIARSITCAARRYSSNHARSFATPIRKADVWSETGMISCMGQVTSLAHSRATIIMKRTRAHMGCVQIANQFSDCAPAIPNSVVVITEDDKWRSLRIGINGEIMVADRLKLGADVAYLPHVEFNGTDNHVLRTLVINESGTGKGVQFEGILSCLITDQFSIGIGWRYWAMWATKDAIADPWGAPCPCQTQPAKAERYGTFLQADYKVGVLR